MQGITNQLFNVHGLTCEACIKLTTKRIRSLSGVTDVSVELATGKTIVAANREISLTEINAALAGSHYMAEVYHD